MGHNVTKDANGERITFQQVDELFQFLQGVEVLQGISCKDMPHLSLSEAFSVIYFLQEQLEVLPDWVEQCEGCETLLDAESEGHYGEGIGHFCDSCTEKCECVDCRELGQSLTMSYDTERNDRLREEAWFNCAKCGKEVRESEWASLCQECGEAEEADERGENVPIGCEHQWEWVGSGGDPSAPSEPEQECSNCGRRRPDDD